MEDQKFHLKAPFSMMGDQPEAVRRLVPPATADIIFCKHTR